MAWQQLVLGALLIALGAHATADKDWVCLLVELRDGRLSDVSGGSSPGRPQVEDCKRSINSAMDQLLSQAKTHGIAVASAQALPAVFDGFDVHLAARDAARFEELARASGRVADVFPCAAGLRASGPPSSEAAVDSLAATAAARQRPLLPGATQATYMAIERSLLQQRQRQAGGAARRLLQDPPVTMVPPIGLGVRIGILTQNGLDYTNPGLSGGFGPNQKVSFGYDFWGADPRYAAPDPDPILDCNNNRTEGWAEVTAGEAAGQYRAQDENGTWATLQSGVAPGAQLGVYKLSATAGCHDAPALGDELYNDDNYAAALIRALNAAYEDGMDIVVHTETPNGSGNGAWYFERIVDLGVVVVTHPGWNPGSIFYTSDLANVPGVLSAGSHSYVPHAPRAFSGRADINAGDFSADFQGVDLELMYPPGNASHDPSPSFLDGLVGLPFGLSPGWAANASVMDDACVAGTINSTDAAGKVLLVKRGTCAVSVKVLNALGAGAAAVMVVGTNDLPWGPTWIGEFAAIGFNGSVMLVSATLGDKLAELVRGGAVVAFAALQATGYVYDGAYMWANTPTGPAMDFALPTHVVLPKDANPQLAPVNFTRSDAGPIAPGLVTSWFEGPPVAAGRLAGYVAALIQRLRFYERPFQAADLKRRLMNTATPVPRTFSGAATYENPVHAGAGMPDWSRAADTPCLLDRSNIVLATGARMASVTFAIRCSYDASNGTLLTFNLTHARALSYKMWGGGVKLLRDYFEQVLLPPAAPALPATLPPSLEGADVAFSVGGLPAERVVVPPNHTVTIKATFSVHSSLLLEPYLFGGYIRLEPTAADAAPAAAAASSAAAAEPSPETGAFGSSGSSGFGAPPSSTPAAAAAPAAPLAPALTLPYHGLSTKVQRIPIFNPELPLEVQVGNGTWFPVTRARVGAPLNASAVPELVLVGDGRQLDSNWVNSSMVANATGLSPTYFSRASLRLLFITLKPSRLVAWELLANATGKVLGLLNATALVRGSPNAILPSGTVSCALQLSFKDLRYGAWVPMLPGVYRTRLTVKHIRGVADDKEDKMPTESVTTPAFRVVSRDPMPVKQPQRHL